MEQNKNKKTFFIRVLENLFKRWGHIVSNHPGKIIILCVITTALCGLGLFRLRLEHRAEMLWIPETSPYNVHAKWLDNNFKQNKRHQQVLVNGHNILTPEGLKKMLSISKSIASISANGKTFNDLCSRIPTADIFHSKKRKKRNSAIFLESTKHPVVKLNVSKDDKDDYDYGSDDYYYTRDYDSLWGDTSDYNNDDKVDITSFVKSTDWTKYNDRQTTDNLPPSVYCDLVNTLDDVCVQRSLLEIWKFDEDRILSASAQEILDAVNVLETSPWFGFSTDFGALLGGVERNSSGAIISATTADMYWAVDIQEGEELVHNRGGGFENGLADATTLDWEHSFINVVLNMSGTDFTIIPFAGRSFGDISAGAVFFDGYKMAAGYILMFIFTVIMIGRMDWVEVRLYLSVAGIVGIVMGLVISISLSALIGVPYTPMHTLLPFLLLGIGIDDMFVITQSWINLSKESATRQLPLSDRVSETLQHAGVAITVTSLTDIFAFGIGAISQMPGLIYFCISSAIGLGSIYLLSVTWFVAWLALDERRISSKRSGLLPCLVAKEPPRRSVDINQLLQKQIQTFSSLLRSNIAKAAVLLFTLGLFGIGVWGSIHVKQRFDWLLMMPEDSYTRQWLNLHNREYLADGGQFGNWREGSVFTGEIDHSRLDNLDLLVGQLQQELERGEFLADLDPWWVELKKYATTKKNLTSWEDMKNSTIFTSTLSDFLFSPEGTKYQKNFRWQEPLQCNKPVPNITASKFSITFKNLDDNPKKHYLAKKTIEDLVEQSQVSSKSFSYVNMMYLVWENEDIVRDELWRNIGLAMACVFVITFFLLANLTICLMVLTCVILTLVDTTGFLFFWNIDIYFLSMVYIVIAVGLCVDYSVHIAHAFIISKGSREERAISSLNNIGPAVLNGGVTTFLALFLLGFSTTHVFITFFKVFVLTVIFGLFHGLVFFPVILSMIGPQNQQSESSGASIEPSQPSNTVKHGQANLTFVAENFKHTLEINPKFVE